MNNNFSNFNANIPQFKQQSYSSPIAAYINNLTNELIHNPFTNKNNYGGMNSLSYDIVPQVTWGTNVPKFNLAKATGAGENIAFPVQNSTFYNMDTPLQDSSFQGDVGLGNSSFGSGHYLDSTSSRSTRQILRNAMGIKSNFGTSRFVQPYEDQVLGKPSGYSSNAYGKVPSKKETKSTWGTSQKTKQKTSFKNSSLYFDSTTPTSLTPSVTSSVEFMTLEQFIKKYNKKTGNKMDTLRRYYKPLLDIRILFYFAPEEKDTSAYYSHDKKMVYINLASSEVNSMQYAVYFLLFRELRHAFQHLVLDLYNQKYQANKKLSTKLKEYVEKLNKSEVITKKLNIFRYKKQNEINQIMSIKEKCLTQDEFEENLRYVYTQNGENLFAVYLEYKNLYYEHANSFKEKDANEYAEKVIDKIGLGPEYERQRQRQEVLQQEI